MATKTILPDAAPALLLDVGGTCIKCSDGREVPIDSAGSREEIVGALREAVGDAERVAVAIPGPFDYHNGVFLMKHKFAAVYGERFAELVAPPDAPDAPSGHALSGRKMAGQSTDPRLHHADAHPVISSEGEAGVEKSFVFVHDVNAMLLGALQDPELAQYRRIALVTLGTGLGFAVSIDGKFQTNESGSPNIPLYNRPYLDGIAEDYASKRGVMHAWSEVTGRVWPEEQTVKGIVGTPEGEAAFALMGERLAEAVAPLLAELGIECLLFGGQISRSFALFAPSLRSGLAKVPTLRHIGPISDIGNATFNGLKSLLH